MPMPHRDPASIPRRDPLPIGSPTGFEKLVVIIVVIILSFWIALMVLDNWVFNQGDQSHPTRIFTLDPRLRNWSEANLKTRAVVTEKGVALASTADADEYQWLTIPISIRSKADLIVSYKIEVTNGKMGIGVLDFANDKWIVTKDVTTQSDTIAFKTQSPQIQVILFGTGTPPSSATVLDLIIIQP
jgi:hypothetical protein